jgi:hypothetical protein
MSRESVNEKRIRRLMQPMGFLPIYQKLNTSREANAQQWLTG